jgi:ATP-binding cassette subfamily B protein
MSARNPSIDRLTLRHFWQVSLYFKKDLFLALIFPIGSVATGTLLPLYISKILAALPNPAADPAHYIPYLIGTAIIGILANLIGFVRMLIHQARVMEYLQNEALETLLNRSASFHNNRIGGKLVSDAADYANTYSQLNGAIFATMLPLLIVLVTGVIVVAQTAPILSVVLLLITSITIALGIVDSKLRASRRIHRLKARKDVMSHLGDSIVNNQTVKTFAHESYELNRHRALNHTLFKHRVEDWSASGRQGTYRLALLFCFQVGFIALLIQQVRHNPGLLATGIFAFAYTLTLSTRLFDINTIVRSVEDALLDASPMTSILHEKIEIADKPHAPELHIGKGEIEIRAVNFKYHDNASNEKVFSNLNLTVKPGEKVGIVGPSGGGKSTLTRLLLRFEDIQTGEKI